MKRVERYGAIAKTYDTSFKVNGKPATWNVEDASTQFVEKLGRTPPEEMRAVRTESYQLQEA